MRPRLVDRALAFGSAESPASRDLDTFGDGDTDTDMEVNLNGIIILIVRYRRVYVQYE